MNKELIKQVQLELTKQGFKPGIADGILGPKTEAAIVAFKVSKGLAARPYLGPITLSKLLGGDEEDYLEFDGLQLPWVNELGKHIGWHEVTNNAALRAWLKSDGSTLGDPAKLPWCGDAIETAVRLTLPNEWGITDRRLRANPYWALNWVYFGVQCKPAYGAFAAFRRDGGGHIAVLIGFDKKHNRFRVRGGNQANRISDTWIDAKRMAPACPRKPATWAQELPPLPYMDSEGQIISQNEA